SAWPRVFRWCSIALGPLAGKPFWQKHSVGLQTLALQRPLHRVDASREIGVGLEERLVVALQRSEPLQQRQVRGWIVPDARGIDHAEPVGFGLHVPIQAFIE